MSGPMSGPTPGQTVGPFFGFGLPYPGDAELVPTGYPGAVQLTGLVLDGAGVPVPDALVEVWQADPQGNIVQVPGSLRRDGWTFTGFGRGATDAAGRYSFTTLLPGATAPGRPPFFAITLFARGLLDRLFTRAYLPVDEADVAADPLLAGLPASRRASLLIRADGPRLEFDIRLQGEDETVFLCLPDAR
jgi:protocatechuate 3,4-dioxygenase alpha subunit